MMGLASCPIADYKDRDLQVSQVGMGWSGAHMCISLVYLRDTSHYLLPSKSRKSIKRADRHREEPHPDTEVLSWGPLDIHTGSL